MCARLSMQKLFCRHVETRGVEREQAARILKKAEEKGLAETGTRGRGSGGGEGGGRRGEDGRYIMDGEGSGSGSGGTERKTVAAVGPQAFD